MFVARSNRRSPRHPFPRVCASAEHRQSLRSLMRRSTCAGRYHCPSPFAIEIDYQLTVIVQIHSGVENPAADAMPCPSDQSSSPALSRPRRARQISSGPGRASTDFTLDRVKRSRMPASPLISAIRYQVDSSRFESTRVRPGAAVISLRRI
jgi:hypothetical protein